MKAVQFTNRHGIQFVLASIGINALIGIIAIVSGDFSSLDGKVLVTSLSVTGASVLALANLTARERGALRYVPDAGAIASVIGFALLILTVWGEFSEDNLIKSAVTGILIGIGTAHGSLLSLSRLTGNYLMALRAAWALAALMITLLLVMIWHGNVTDSTAFIQTVGVVGVLLAAVTIAVPVLQWSGKGAAQAELAGDWHITHCPNCGDSHISETGIAFRCGVCGAVFSVTYSAKS